MERKYRLVLASRRRKLGLEGPSPEPIAAIVEMKRRKARFGCRRIAQQMTFVSGVDIDKRGSIGAGTDRRSGKGKLLEFIMLLGAACAT